jgi:MFS family permease
MARQFGVPIGFKSQLMMSIFLIGYAQGPFVLAPLSETFGRVKVLQWANLVFLCFNIACGFATSYEQMLAFRFLSGLGGAAPQAVSYSSSHSMFIHGANCGLAWKQCFGGYLEQGATRPWPIDLRHADFLWTWHCTDNRRVYRPGR